MRLEVDAIDGCSGPAGRRWRLDAVRDMATVGGARRARRGNRSLGSAATTPTTDGDNPLANATFSSVTDWEGTEERAEISPDGRSSPSSPTRQDSSTSGSVGGYWNV